MSNTNLLHSNVQNLLANLPACPVIFRLTHQKPNTSISELTMNKTTINQVEAKIAAIEDELNSSEYFLSETQAYLVNELDQQKLILAKLTLEERFARIDSEEWS